MILFKTIRSQTAIYLFILLFSGMFLIAVAALFSFQNLAVRFAAKNFFLSFEILTKSIKQDIETKERLLSGTARYEFNIRIKNSGACRVYVIDDESRSFDFGLCREGLESMPELAELSLKNNDILTRFVSYGLNFPFFSGTRRFFVMSGPVYYDSGICYGAIAAAWDLDSVYSGFSRIEKLLFIYILVNTFVLASVGVYQIGNITAKPLARILKKTESACPYNIPEFNIGNSDFEKLSSSISHIIDDLTIHRKQLQETVNKLEFTNHDLKKMQKDIIMAEKMASIGRLSAGLAHEIGNPLGIISGYLELMKNQDVLDSEIKDYAERAGCELDRIDRIIRQLLDYARPSETVRDHVSVHAVINEVRDAFSGSGAIGKNSISVDMKALKDIVFINPEHLRQIILNILINAADAIAAVDSSADEKFSGTIMISTVNHNWAIHQDAVMISFIDNGCGISESEIEYIFEPFYTTKPAGKGTGLGLSVSQMIVDEAGGIIKARNMEGGGTEISVILPVSEITTMDENDGIIQLETTSSRN